MKKKNILVLAMLSLGTMVTAQYNTDWYFPNQANTTQAGYIGIGTKTTTTSVNTPLPNFNLHVHGSVDYIESGNVSSFNPLDPPGTMISSTNKSNTNWGITSRIGLTNSLTGMSDMEGTALQASGLDFYLKNQALGGMYFSTHSNMNFLTSNLELQLNHSTGRAWFGGIGLNPSSSNHFAKFNMIVGSDNGLFIQTQNSAKYGITLKMQSTTADAIAVWGPGNYEPGTKQFKVTGGGEVYARRYTTTLNNIPDYVFASSYNLMPLSELRKYIQTEQHLPNIPAAEVMESAPVDLGEMNRLLLEKVEELTLYVLDLEERLGNIENKED